MTGPSFDATLDLTVQRVIHAPREAIWRAWTTPELLARWWIPAPARARIDRLEVRPGGAFVTSMSEGDDDFFPHTDGIFLVVEEGRRLVFTNAIDSDWRPSFPQPVSMTAEIVLAEHADGTEYRAIVRHGRPEDRDQHETLGFYDGWGSVTAALAVLVESGIEIERSNPPTPA